ncbi:hypothetical protein L917_15457 [Phytophthora nicotianae]|uniref:Uncharacterized protein n=1 Tax=Phytophthora nicotianae TaxID=4792 RepID=W2MNX1_PHYNI|nr:hypothetical protein L917_15457 [Phytophthora nicotianae]ETM38005.1 hypothetical protein L914_15593 [Phytophthora nicotianae]
MLQRRAIHYKKSARQEMIMWTKAAWNSLSASIVASGFCKAKIIINKKLL